MWKVLWCSAQGTSHRQTGQPCQDYGSARLIGIGNQTILLAACADGAGSARHSDVGAKTATEAFLDLASKDLMNGLDVTALNSDIQSSWICGARREVELVAQSMGLPVRELACTLLTAIAGHDSAWFSQIGDGVMVLNCGGSYEFVFWPEAGEYINTTRFLTDHRSEAHLRCSSLNVPVYNLALMTDGLQMLALNTVEMNVFEKFFRPMFELLRSTPEREDLRPRLLAFLDSDRVNDRTNDDKTLILATRVPYAEDGKNYVADSTR